MSYSRWHRDELSSECHRLEERAEELHDENARLEADVYQLGVSDTEAKLLSEVTRLQVELAEAKAQFAHYQREKALNMVFGSHMRLPTAPPGEKDDYSFSDN